MAFRGARPRRASPSTRSHQTAPGRSLIRSEVRQGTCSQWVAAPAVSDCGNHPTASPGQRSLLRPQPRATSPGTSASWPPLARSRYLRTTCPVSHMSSSIATGPGTSPLLTGFFGQPQPTAVPTSLVDDDGTLVMSVELYDPGQRLGYGTSSVAVLTSSNGTSWRTVTRDAFDDSTVNQLLPVPAGLLAVGSAPLTGPNEGRTGSWTGAFASLSLNGGASWPTEPISPANLGGVGSETVPGAGDVATGDEADAGAGTSAIAGAGAGTSVTSAGAGPGVVQGSDVEPGTAPVIGPLVATAAGRLGNSDYVIGEAGPQAVGWYSPDGTAWEAPQPLDTSPQLGTERPLATCWTGNSAVVVGSVTSTIRGSLPAAWVSSDGSSWTNASFSPSPPTGSTTTVNGCLSTGNGFIAYGGSTANSSVQQPVLWSSTDGTVWQQLSASFSQLGGGAPVGWEAAPLDGIATGTTTWLGLSGDGDLPSQRWPAPVGGSAGAQSTVAGLWSSRDAGNTWQQLDTAVPPFEGATYAQADVAAYVAQQPVVAGTVDGRLAIWVGKPVGALGGKGQG